MCLVCLGKEVRMALLFSHRFRKVTVPHEQQHETLFLPYTPNYTPSSPLSLSFFATMPSTSMNRDVVRDLEAQQGILQAFSAASYHLPHYDP